MSLVSEVLTTIKQRVGVEGSSLAALAGDGLCVEVADLINNASEARVAVIQALDSQYTELCSALQDTKALQTRVERNLGELESLHSSLDGDVRAAVAQSVDDVTDVAGRWHQAMEELKIAQQLLEIHESLKKAGEDYKSKEYMLAAKGIAKVRELVDAIPGDVAVLASMQEEATVQTTRLSQALSLVWSQLYKWEEHTDHNNIKTVTFRIRSAPTCAQDNVHSSDCGDSQVVQQLTADMATAFAVMHMHGELQFRVHTFAKDIMNNLLRVAVLRESRVSCQQDQQTNSLSIAFATAPKHASGRTMPKPDYRTVFSNVTEILDNLNDFGCGIEFDTGEDGITTSLMRLIGEQISTTFTELLISDCLSDAVPYSRKDLGVFDVVKADTTTLHQHLVETGFYGRDEVSILEYAANVDTVFSDKACAHVLSTARDLITRPLHDTVTIAAQETPALAVQDESGTMLEKSTLRLEKLLAAKTFHMPHCKLSASACQLVDLIYETLEEACGSSDQFAGRLVCTVRNVLELYRQILPVAHADTLSSIPQHAALVHNNCMYIAHHCYILGHQFKTRLPAGVRASGTCVTSYTDIAQLISTTGADLFCAAMQRHKKALLDTVGQAQGFGEVPSDTGVRQCLHQLQLLRNVWRDVLPHSVYNKAMGTLLNSVAKDLIERVTSLEDISEDSAKALTASLSTLISQGPDLFPESDTVTTSISSSSAGSAGKPSAKEGVAGVRQWGRLKELLLVLGASLRQLQDRWADGKGPLAFYFTPDQAKGLIRALFQNTDRRAQLLAKIKLQ